MVGSLVDAFIRPFLLHWHLVTTLYRQLLLCLFAGASGGPAINKDGELIGITRTLLLDSFLILVSIQESCHARFAI